MSYGSINSGSTSELIERQIKDILLLAHPVGSLYMSDDATSPAELFGGTWEQIAGDRALMGASSTHPAGTTAEAGLPNITGSFGMLVSPGGYSRPGALYGSFFGALSGSAYAATQYEETSSDITNFVGFDASISSQVYGRATTVQPPAYYSYIWKRLSE